VASCHINIPNEETLSKLPSGFHIINSFNNASEYIVSITLVSLLEDIGSINQDLIKSLAVLLTFPVALIPLDVLLPSLYVSTLRS
ncbi:MAG: hypothetical protein MUO62_18150, partial [Anaerolineales bacterium]|nr:hypothetical protein [Anaerolineales bacterium]